MFALIMTHQVLALAGKGFAALPPAVRAACRVVTCLWQRHPAELLVLLLWLASFPVLLLLHAAAPLGEWTPLLIDPVLVLAAAMSMRSAQRNLRLARQIPPAR